MKNKTKWISENPQCKQIESCYNSLSKKCICPTEQPKEYVCKNGHSMRYKGVCVYPNCEEQNYLVEKPKCNECGSLRITPQKPNGELLCSDCWSMDIKQGYNHASKTLYTESEVLEQLNLLMKMPNSVLDTLTDDDGLIVKWNGNVQGYQSHFCWIDEENGYNFDTEIELI